MPEPIRAGAPLHVDRDGHRTWFKWHRARRTLSDPVFTGRRILEGMRLGASVEVDLVIHKDRGFAVLHDETADRETTGSGRVDQLSADTLRQLRLRDNDGKPTGEPVMLLEDLAALLAAGGLSEDALLQLDYKLTDADLDARAVASFARSVAPVARHMILSSGDAGAVRRLTEAAPGVRVGYDPCHDGALERLARTRDYKGFVAEALAASPRAEMIYLAYPMVLAVADDGFDMIGAFQAAGKRIDAYTIKAADETTAPAIWRLLELRADQITTDDPEGLARLVGVLT